MGAKMIQICDSAESRLCFFVAHVKGACRSLVVLRHAS